jgi:hypothetical protein
MAKARAPRSNSKKNGASSDFSAAAPAMAVEKKNIIPINLEDEIRRRAYELYEERNGAPGTEQEDWLRAESEVLARYQQSA